MIKFIMISFIIWVVSFIGCAGLLLTTPLGVSFSKRIAANTKFLLSVFAASFFTIAGNIIPLLNYSQ